MGPYTLAWIALGLIMLFVVSFVVVAVVNFSTIIDIPTIVLAYGAVLFIGRQSTKWLPLGSMRS